MLILTGNQYLKIGLETLIGQVCCNKTERVVIFDAGEDIYILQDTPNQNGYQPNLFLVLALGEYITNDDIKKSENFYQIFTEYQRKKDFCTIRMLHGRLTVCEESIILALCNEYTTIEIATKINKSIKTISCHKINTLRKLGMRNMQCLYRNFIQWSVALKSTSTFPYEQVP